MDKSKKYVKKYVRERNRAIWSCDVQTFKDWARQNELDMPVYPDWWYEGLMAKMALNITSTPESVKTWANGVLGKLGWSASL